MPSGIEANSGISLSKFALLLELDEHVYYYCRLSYQWIYLELGKHQIYELDAMFDDSVIAIKITPNPNLLSEVKDKILVDSNKLIRSVQRFIDDLMKEYMAATFTKHPVVCYIPCSQCTKMHLSVEKATDNSTVYCPVKGVYADITNYHNILSGLSITTSLNLSII